MADLNSLRDAIAAEKQQATELLAAKDQIIAERDATIADLQNQLANAGNIPDDVVAAVQDIIP